MSCNAQLPQFLGDGWCDTTPYNSYMCNYDGGDCCPETCVDGDYPCGVNGYNCRDPEHTQGICNQLLVFDDAHGSYSLWQTSFLKFDGYFDLLGEETYQFGYLPISELDIYFNEDTADLGVMIALSQNSSATFSVVAGKLDGNNALIPCEIEAEGSGPCFTTRSWEIGLSAKSFLNTLYSTENPAWIAPFGSSMTNKCFHHDDPFESILRPVAFTGEGRKHNNVPPPSYHAFPPPLPHESVEFTLTLQDGSGEGWWNTLKLHPNQYVLDDGENILHRGTLVDQAERTEKFRLPDGTYHLRMLGHLDSDAYDDTWILKLNENEIASGGRYDRISFTVSNQQLTWSSPLNVKDLLHSHSSASSSFTTFSSSAPYPIAQFSGLFTSNQFYKLTHDAYIHSIETKPFTSIILTSSQKQALAAELQHTPSLNYSLQSHPLEAFGLILMSTFFGMIVMFGIMKYSSMSADKVASTTTYETVMDNSHNEKIELEKTIKKTNYKCQL